MKSTDRFNCVKFSVEIRIDGAGMSRDDIERMCHNLAFKAMGRAKARKASCLTWVDGKPVYAENKGPFYGV